MTNAPYIERDCTFKHEGQSFEAGGAYIDDSVIVAYPGPDGKLQNWHGATIGTWRATSSWRVNSWIGSKMYQIRATLPDGRTYTGRGFGESMIYRGRRTAS